MSLQNKQIYAVSKLLAERHLFNLDQQGKILQLKWRCHQSACHSLLHVFKADVPELLQLWEHPEVTWRCLDPHKGRAVGHQDVFVARGYCHGAVSSLLSCGKISFWTTSKPLHDNLCWLSDRGRHKACTWYLLFH